MSRSKQGDTERPVSRNRQRAIPALDDMDRHIVTVLQSDGRTSNTDIARQIGVTETTVRKRLAALIDSGLLSIVAVPAPELVGMTVSAIIGISVELRALNDVARSLVPLREVRYCGVSTGRFDLIVEAFFHDHDHVVEFVTQTLGRTPGITAVETSLILKIEKFSYEWQIP